MEQRFGSFKGIAYLCTIKQLKQQEIMADYQRHMALFATLTMLIDHSRGNKITLNGNYIKRAYRDKETDFYMVENNEGKIGLAYDVPSEHLYRDIEKWRWRNPIKFNTIIGI